MTEEEKLPGIEDIANDVALLMNALTQKYQHAPKMLAEALASSLGAFVALSAKAPQVQLARVGNIIKHHDWLETQRDFFGYKLGMNEPKVILPEAVVVPLTGRNHDKPE